MIIKDVVSISCKSHKLGIREAQRLTKLRGLQSEVYQRCTITSTKKIKKLRVFGAYVTWHQMMDEKHIFSIIGKENLGVEHDVDIYGENEKIWDEIICMPGGYRN